MCVFGWFNSVLLSFAFPLLSFHFLSLHLLQNPKSHFAILDISEKLAKRGQAVAQESKNKIACDITDAAPVGVSVQ
jgi:hypothetical protein